MVEILKNYGAATSGQKRVLTQEEEADRPYADIVTAVTLLSNIMTSEFESFSK